MVDRLPEMVPLAQVEAMIAARMAESEKRLADLVLAAAVPSRSPAAAAPVAENAWMEALAMQIATLASQGTGKQVPIAPEELARRKAAEQRMLALIAEAQTKAVEDRPVYRLRHVVFLGEQRIQPVWVDAQHRPQQQEIGWAAIPNEAMEPMNESARAIFAEFCQWIGIGAARDLGEMELTYNGQVVIKGRPNIVEAQHTGAANEAPSHLMPTLRGRGTTGQMTKTRILGTLMPPAQQSA